MGRSESEVPLWVDALVSAKQWCDLNCNSEQMSRILILMRASFIIGCEWQKDQIEQNRRMMNESEDDR